MEFSTENSKQTGEQGAVICLWVLNASHMHNPPLALHPIFYPPSIAQLCNENESQHISPLSAFCLSVWLPLLLLFLPADAFVCCPVGPAGTAAMSDAVSPLS